MKIVQLALPVRMHLCNVLQCVFHVLVLGVQGRARLEHGLNEVQSRG